MSNPIEIPEYLKGIVSSVASDAVSGSGESFPRLTLGKKKFHFKKGKTEEPNASSKPIHVVILGINPAQKLMVKTYYKGAYDPEQTGAPDCQSFDGIKPAGFVSNPVASRCFDCKFNQFGSADAGKGKKCSDSKHLFVVKADDINGTVYCLSVPASSLKNLDKYGKELLEKGAPMEVAVTQLSFNEDEVYPILEFNFVAFLNKENAPVALEKAKAKEWASAIYSASAAALPASEAHKELPFTPEEVKAANPEPKKDDDDLMSQW